MRTFKLVVTFAVTLLGVGWSEARAATATANSEATVVPAIAIAKDRDLDFGQVVAGGTSGTVTMSTAGVRTVSGGTTLGNPGNKGPAIFLVTGQPGAGYGIILPDPIDLLNGGPSMLVDNFTSTPSGSGIMSGAGEQSVNVGAVLHVGANQPPGTYTNTFDVTVAYN